MEIAFHLERKGYRQVYKVFKAVILWYSEKRNTVMYLQGLICQAGLLFLLELAFDLIYKFIPRHLSGWFFCGIMLGLLSWVSVLKKIIKYCH